ncbi:MAG: class I SAM-dependent methyltransferase [Actinomycetota bacterium]
MTTPPAGRWFNPLAEYLGPAYLRNAFTKGTEQEVGFLVEALGLGPGSRVLDVGCGPGRHAVALARRGIEVVGVDCSPDFLALARIDALGLPAEFVEADVRNLSYSSEFDAVICLCQGGFGLLGGGDDEHEVIARLARALRVGGRLALTAFSAWFATLNLEAGETFDPATGVLHERAILRDANGEERTFDLWTTCFTPRELRLLADRAGLTVEGVHGVAPGRYGRGPASTTTPEHLLLARRGD